MALTPVSDLAVTALGSEKVTHGIFDSNVGWTFGQASGGWSYDGTNNEADCDGDQTAGVDLEQDISSVAAELYLLTYKVKNWEAGTVIPQIGGVDGVSRGADGTYEGYITATGTGNLKFQADADFIGSIDTVSVKKILYPGDTDTIGLTWSNPDSYDFIDVQYDKGAGWVTYVSELAGDTTSYDVDDIVSNTLYDFRLLLRTPSNPVGSRRVYSNTDAGAIWTDTLTDEIIVSESISDYGTGSEVADILTDTVYMSDFIVDATDIITNFAYYVATASGEVYEYNSFYKSDAGTAITARWESKDTDFADQSIEYSDKFKTVEFIRLHYIDKSAGALISIEVSADGGATWTTTTKNIGKGDNKGKTKDFYFTKTGQIFRFAVENVSTSDDFQWTGFEVFYNVGGDYFEVN